jgi:zinc protease
MSPRFPALCLAAALASAAAPASAILPIQHWQAASGARVYFVENHDLPMLDVSVEFPGGSAYDRRPKSGVASMTQRLLTSGADGMSEDEVSRRIADIGAQLGGRFDADRAGLSVRTLSSEAERRRAIDILARSLRAPSFPEAVLEREKVRLIGSLKEADTKPDTIVSRTFYRLAYREHPYALRSSGEVGTVEGITREDLLAFHRRHYAARYAVVALMGDVTRARAEAIAEELTRGLPEAGGQEPAVPPVEGLGKAVSRTVPHHAAQAHILIGAPAVTRADPDYIALFVGNFVLGGGGFVSRITEEVRQKRGLAYSASSYFYPLQRKGPFVISMQTRSDQAEEALKVARATLAGYVRNGPTADELEAAKRNIVDGFPLRIDSNRKIHEHLALIGFYRLPLDYLEDFVRRVERVSAADIREAFRRHVDPARMVTVVVAGDSPRQADAR